MRPIHGWICLLASALLGGCGSYTVPTQAGAGGTGSGGSVTPASSVQKFFGKNTQVGLNFCRTCHVPGGVAGTPGTSTAPAKAI